MVLVTTKGMMAKNILDIGKIMTCMVSVFINIKMGIHMKECMKMIKRLKEKQKLLKRIDTRKVTRGMSINNSNSTTTVEQCEIIEGVYAILINFSLGITAIGVSTSCPFRFTTARLSTTTSSSGTRMQRTH
jgi:hypothetical protein